MIKKKGYKEDIDRLAINLYGKEGKYIKDAETWGYSYDRYVRDTELDGQSEFQLKFKRRVYKKYMESTGIPKSHKDKINAGNKELRKRPRSKERPQKIGREYKYRYLAKEGDRTVYARKKRLSNPDGTYRYVYFSRSNQRVDKL